MKAVCAALALLGSAAALSQRMPAPVMPSFDDIAERAGINFWLDSGTIDRPYLIESFSAGVVLIDYDNDGWLDLYFINGSTPDRIERGEKSKGNRLFRNNHNGTFTDVTAKAGVAGNGAWGMGGCIGDVDDNGFDDIFITNYGQDVLYLNNGDGTFRDATREAGVDGGNHWHTGCAFGDYNGDGKIDLYVARYADFSIASGKLSPASENPFAAPDVQRRYRMAARTYQAQPHELYQNLGGGRFVEVGEKAGIRKAPVGYGVSVAWADFDNDGKPDLFVANDSTPNFLFHNNGDGTFSEVAAKSGVAFGAFRNPQPSTGVSAADFDNDGNVDLFIASFENERAALHPGLYRGDGRGAFADVTAASGLADTTKRYYGWGTQFVDLDLDGSLDLVTANGHVDPKRDDAPVRPGEEPPKELRVSYFERPLVFRNHGDGTFDETGEQLGGIAARHVGRGLAVGDLNNDGQMDLVIANQEERPSVLMNRGVKAGHWSLIKLRARASNRSAIGARVIARSGTQRQTRVVTSGGSYLSQSDLRLHFGLGSATKIDELTVIWPSGRTQTSRNVPGDRIITITEDR